MTPTHEQLVAFITECCSEHKKWLDLSDDRIDLIASYVRMRMTHEDRLKAEAECNQVVAQLKSKLDGRTIKEINK